ncbi:MAG: DNA-directed RNA polymerase subunit beta [Pseudoclavibacter sp.]
MTDRHHRPVRVPSNALEGMLGGYDPSEVSRVAHDTAAALLHRGRETGDPEVVSRLVAFTDEHGIDDLAELWSAAAVASLPGAMWRLYLIREIANRNAEGTAYMFQRGIELDRTISHVVAGAVTPTGPEEIVVLCDEILRGAFTGDVGIALERASAFCRIMAQGAAELSASSDGIDEQRAAAFTRRGARYLELAEDLHAAAMRWQDDSLD